MSARRETRRFTLLSLIGVAGLTIGAFSMWNAVFPGERAEGAAATADAGRKQLARLDAAASAGMISADDARVIGRGLIRDLANERLAVRLVENGENGASGAVSSRFAAWNWTVSVDPLDDRAWPGWNLAGLLSLLAGGFAFVAIPARRRRRRFGFSSSAAAERLSAVMDGAEEAILILDEGGRVRSHNEAADRLFGRRIEGTPLAELFDERNRAEIDRSVAARVGRIESLTARRVDGVFDASFRLRPIDGGGCVAVVSDVTARLRDARELERASTHDRLTGLPNRGTAVSVLNAAIERAGREGSRVALLSVDLSRFRLITDALGGRAGERLVVEMAKRISAATLPGDTVARVGVDDFAVILDPADEPRARTTARTILASFEDPVRLIDTDHFVRPSVGIAVWPDHAADAEGLLRAGDTALYAAKKRGGSRAQTYEHRLGETAKLQLELDQEMRRGLIAGEFLPHYQPKVSLLDGSIRGFEALARWNRPGVGLARPDVFLNVAEDTGFIGAIDEWMLNEVCRQLREWIDVGLEPPPIAVNVSPAHLRVSNVDDFERALVRHHVPPALIEVEVTEHAVMRDVEHAMDVLGGLRDLGVRVAVDDFGTGHSSLNYLKRLPVSILKIDRCFIDGVPRGREDSGIVATIIAMARTLRLGVVAEGVERPEQARFLARENCPLVQGWLTGRPVPAAAAAALLSPESQEAAARGISLMMMDDCRSSAAD